MKRFAGKCSFVIDGRKLVFWEQRAGLISKDRKTIRKDGTTVMVPLPPEASVFLVIDKGDGTFVLQTCNAEALSFNQFEHIVTATSYPEGYRLYPVPNRIARFNLAAFKQARTIGDWKMALSFHLEGDDPKKRRSVTWERGKAREVDDIWGARYLTNLGEGRNPLMPDLWQVIPLADGIDDMKDAKKVAYFDFRRNGEAIVDLAGEDLSGVDFGKSDFTGCQLTGTIMTGSRHDKSCFHGATLDSANLQGSTLINVDFSAASMKRTILTGVTGSGGDFSDCDLRTVVSAAPLALTSTKEKPVRFSRAKLRYPLVGNDWLRKKFDDATIENIPKIGKLNAQFVDLTNVDLVGLEVDEANFNDAMMRGVQMYDAKLPNAQFKNATLDAALDIVAADLTAAQLQGAKFDEAKLSGVSFEGARLDETSFVKATVNLAVFANAYLKAVSFAAVEQKTMTGANFSRAFLVGCDFTGADLSTHDDMTVNMAEAYLQGTNFTSAKLSGTIMSGAGISEEEGELSVKLDNIVRVVSYEPTTIDPEVSTSNKTVCPNGRFGPCEGNKLRTPKPFPKSWPWPGVRKPKARKRTR